MSYDEPRGLNEALKEGDMDVERLEQAKEYLRNLGEAIVSEAKSNLQNNTSVVTGHLLSTIRVFDELSSENGDGITIVVGTDADYAEYIEYGRGPVRPVNAMALHWIDPETGKDVFAQYAGPTEPQPFMEPAVLKYTEMYPSVLAEQLGGDDE